jgi:hypothetical protein
MSWFLHCNWSKGLSPLIPDFLLVVPTLFPDILLVVIVLLWAKTARVQKTNQFIIVHAALTKKLKKINIETNRFLNQKKIQKICLNGSKHFFLK